KLLIRCWFQYLLLHNILTYPNLFNVFFSDKPFLTIFPNSNPNAIFFEIEAEYELGISMWLGYEQHTQQELDSMSDLVIHVFEDIFTASKPIFVMVNHWDMIRDVYMLNQFEAFKQGNFTSRVFIDE